MTVSVSSNIVASLNVELKKIKDKNVKGVTKAVLLIKRESLKITPVRTGNLRGSCYTEVYKRLSGPVGIIGYTAAYAPYVHEIKKNYNKGEWKYLEKALKYNKQKVLNIIRNESIIG